LPCFAFIGLASSTVFFKNYLVLISSLDKIGLLYSSAVFLFCSNPLRVSLFPLRSAEQKSKKGTHENREEKVKNIQPTIKYIGKAVKRGERIVQRHQMRDRNLFCGQKTRKHRAGSGMRRSRGQ
jgi:hypothetical protein